jgi:hypothetical protein
LKIEVALDRDQRPAPLSLRLELKVEHGDHLRSRSFAGRCLQ